MTLEERVRFLEKEFVRITHHLNTVTEAVNENTDWRREILEATVVMDEEEITFTPDKALLRDKAKDH